MIQINKRRPTDRLLELGCGDRPHPACDVHVDSRPMPGVDFTADLNEPLPIKDQDFDGIYSCFAFEHISWRKVPQLLAECFRVLKPGGMLLLVLPNTEAQIRHILDHPEGWDGRSAFDSFSCVLFGDQDYRENSHSSFWSPATAEQLLGAAGFTDIVTQPFGVLQTDMVLTATRPTDAAVAQTPQEQRAINPEVGVGQVPEVQSEPPMANAPLLPSPEIPAEQRFNRLYFESYFGPGSFYWDHPVNEIVAKHVLGQHPESMLELGCGRGYVLKRIRDMGIYTEGLEVSKHAYLTRVAGNIYLWDICRTEWPMPANREMDLCFSHRVLDLIPRHERPAVIAEMVRTCKRGLHSVSEPAEVSIWRGLFSIHAPDWPVRLVEAKELETAPDPDWARSWMEGDGKIKLNLGSYMTMFHRGWDNLDVHDHLNDFARQFGYRYRKHDVRNGLPYGTAMVDLIYTAHMVEHLTYDEGLRLFRECRRVLKPGGAMRIIVPEARFLMALYQHRNAPPGSTTNPFAVELSDFDHINEGCEKARTAAGKLHAVLYAGGHQSIYDDETLKAVLEEAGFKAKQASFRQALSTPSSQQILRETLDVLPCLSLYMDAVPNIP